MSIRIVAAIFFSIGSWLAIADDESDLLNMLSMVCSLQTHSATIALELAEDDSTRRYVKQLELDLPTLKKDLQELSEHLQIPLHSDAELQAHAYRLGINLEESEEFDVHYADQQVALHSDLLHALNTYNRRGDNAAVQQYVNSLLPRANIYLNRSEGLQVSARKSAQKTLPRTHQPVYVSTP